MALTIRTTLDVLRKNLPARLPTLLLGRPGAGKTSIVLQVADELGMRPIVFHPVLSDPTDFKGLPAVVAGKAEFLPYGEFRALLESTEPTVAFLDDLAHAPRSVQAALMHLVHPDSRRIGNQRLPDTVSIVAASNRREDRAGADQMLSALWSRFPTIVTVDADLASWLDWALGRDLNPFVLAYLRRCPADLSQSPRSDFAGFPSPRSWEYVARNLDLDLPVEARFEIVQNLLGEECATKFWAYLRTAEEMPDPAEILRQPLRAAVPDDPSLKYAITIAFSRIVRPDTAAAALAYLDRCGEEYGALWVTLTTPRAPENLETAAYRDWAIAHPDLTSEIAA